MSSHKMSCGLWLKHCLLVIVSVGLEACVGLEVVFMIANIQTLGVPIRYSSLPGTISAAFGVILIPTMGFIMDKWAKSRSAKAKILVLTCSLEVLGSLFIFTGNAIKLLYFDSPSLLNSTTQLPQFNSTPSPVTQNSSDPWDISNVSFSSFSPTTTHTLSSQPRVTPEESSIRYFAILAMVGYCLLDCGYDSSNCFLKTFAISTTSPVYHSSIIAKSVFVSSFGGFTVAILGSIGLGSILTSGTTHDSSAAQSAFVAGLCFVLLVCGLSTSFLTGFCCRLTSDRDDLPESSTAANEKSQLIISTEVAPELSSSQRAMLLSHGSIRANGFASGSHKTYKPPPKGEDDQGDLLPVRTGVAGFCHRHKKQILINLFTFFVLGSLYSFEVYAVNFVGDGIFQGDPQAPVGSVDYQNYLKGIEVGSQGTLIYYITFTICTALHEIILDNIGWKVEVLVTAAVNVVVNLTTALTANLWAYYATAVWTGAYRTVVMTVPYILANRFASEKNNGKESGLAIALVAAMLPCGFTVCSALMGPLIDVTGNAATPLFYAATTTFLGLITILFLKDD